MILLPISVLILTCLVGKAFTEILHCYECEDCQIVHEAHLRACSVLTYTIPPLNILPDESTTIALPSTTSKLATTILTTTKTEQPDTTIPIIEPESTLPPTIPTTPGEDETANAEDTPEEINEDDTEKVKRSIRQVNYRSLMTRRAARETEVHDYCYTIVGYGGNLNKIKKGCVQVPSNRKACDILNDHHNIAYVNCKICKEDKCNNSSVRRNYLIWYPMCVILIVFLIENADGFIN